jgi:biopolymer transport protein ExbD
MKVDKKRSEPEIPTASMADIAFLLIVFFMITSVFSVTRGMEFQLPKNDNNEAPPDSSEEAIHVHVIPAGSDCIFEVDKQQLGLAEIQIYIEPKLARNPNKFVIIDPDPDAPYRCMVDAFDELKQAQVKNISIPTAAEKAAWGGVI